MALIVSEASFNETSGDKKLQINGNSRRLYLKGKGFLLSEFPLEVIVLNENGNAKDVRIKVGDVGEDISDKSLSVIISATDGESDKLEEGARDVVLKKKGSEWNRVTCIQNDDNDNSECALVVGAVELFK